MVDLRPTLELRQGDDLVTHVLALPGVVWFQGHFPSGPLLPGVAMLALVEQSIDLFWSDAGQAALRPALRIDSWRRIRFRQRVKPGVNLCVRIHRSEPSTLRFSVEVNGRAACTGECTVSELER